jgi:predicted dithiol-disulfide oxidoreductase (DUF899 family)
MNYKSASEKLAAYRRRIADLRRKMRAVQDSAEPEEVEDYAFAAAKGPVRLSQLFGGKKDLFVVHNMGARCPYCTLWADGYNGIYDHLADRAAFVVASPDPPAAQKKFAQSRGWTFPMVSHQGTTFAADMGYRTADGGWLPGVSVFKRGRRRILRVADTGFRPGDDFCALWHFLDLLPEGDAGWMPKFRYR